VLRKVRVRDLDEARPALVELVSLLPKLQVVVLCGRKAQEGCDRARLAPDLPVLRVPHPSGPWLNAHPEDRDRIVAALVEARLLAYRK
jgi:uracil-DNA glycosylase